MSKWNIYTPEGVQDITGPECYIKKQMEEKARKIFESRGYHVIETPTIEFYDVFSSGKNILSQESMFKFFDKEGRILVLRPDMTVPAARLAATKMKDKKKPLCFSYIGNTFKYNQSGGGKQKEYTQAGVEVIGVKGPEADTEVIVTAIELIKALGLENFQVDIGQVEFFKGLMEEAGFNEEETEELRRLIDSKDYLDLEEIIKGKNMSAQLKELILSLPGLFGSADLIENVEKLKLNKRSMDALSNLRSILDILKDYGCEKYVSIDLGMVPSLEYYTGMIFRGFTYGVGFPILSGGRYDNLLGNFGDEEYATGFSAGINMLISAMRRQKLITKEPSTDYYISYEEGCRAQAFKKARELRGNGKSVQMDVAKLNVTEALEYCLENNIRNLIYIKSGGIINEFDLQLGEPMREGK